MTIPSQDYAALADDAYKAREAGVRAPGREEQIYLNGNQYKIIEHVDDARTGYQGTLYQRVSTKEFVVAHRGTEQILKDGLITDGSMVLARSNPQVAEAVALTGRAVELAARRSQDAGRELGVTVTGHSLGGSLTQITAHHHDLKGETFNAYGAVSLSGLRIPEGGHAVINHVMAADAVSAASPHYGEVRIYATEKEIKTLSDAGFSNSAFNALIPDYPLTAAAASLDSHKMGEFLGSASILANSQGRWLAERNERMIEEYRDDLDTRRTALTVITRGVPGGAVDLMDKLRGPLDPGEPARRALEQNAREHNLPAPLRMDDAAHPGHALFKDAQRGVHAQDARIGRTPDILSDQLAGSLATRMHSAGGTRIDAVVMSQDATNTFAVQGRLEDPAQLRVTVETVTAYNTPLEQSTAQLEAQDTQRQAQALDRQQHEQQQVSVRGLA